MARGTTLRNVRIDDELWERLRVVADARGTDRSEVIRAALDVALKRATFTNPPTPRP